MFILLPLHAGLSLPDSLPASGDYNLTSPNGASHSVRFDSSPGGGYTLEKTTTETDGTVSSFTQTANATSVRTSTGISARDYNLGVQFTDNLLFFAADGDGLIVLNGIQSTEITSGQTVAYSGDTITISSGQIIQNVNALYFYDGFLFYRFNGSKINDLSGPGKLYVNRGVALYSTSPSLTSQLDGLIRTIPVDPENPEEPENPEVPENTEVPENPEEPENPEVPENTEAPESTLEPSPSASSIIASPSITPPLSTSPTPLPAPLLPSPDVSRPTMPTRSRPRPQTQQPPENSRSRPGSQPEKSKPHRHRPSPPDNNRPSSPGSPRNEASKPRRGRPDNSSERSDHSDSRNVEPHARPEHTHTRTERPHHTRGRPEHTHIHTERCHHTGGRPKHTHIHRERPEHMHSETSNLREGRPETIRRGSQHGSSRQATGKPSANPPNRHADRSHTRLSSRHEEPHRVSKRSVSQSLRKLVQESTTSSPNPKHGNSEVNDQLSTTNNTNFTFSFQSSVVSLLANGNELLTLTGAQMQTVPMEFIILYQNNSVIIHRPSEEEANLETIHGLEELITFDGFQLNSYAGSAPLEIVGGGQIYVSGNKAFYSTDNQLNMQIGDALHSQTAVPTPTSSLSSPSVTPHPLQPNSTTPGPEVRTTTKPVRPDCSIASKHSRPLTTPRPYHPEENPNRPESPGSQKENLNRPESPGSQKENSNRPESPGSQKENSNRPESPGSQKENSNRPESPGSQKENSNRPVEPEYPGSQKEHSKRPVKPESPGSQKDHSKRIRPEHTRHSNKPKEHSRHIKPEPTRKFKENSKIAKPEPIRFSEELSRHVKLECTSSRHPKPHVHRRSFVVRPLPPSGSSPPSMMIPVPGIPGAEIEINQTDGRVTLFNSGVEVIEFTEAVANYIPEMQTIKYANATITITNQDKQLLDKISDIESFTKFDNNLFEVFTQSSSLRSITSGGMFYQTGRKAFFSSSSSLNSQITNAMEDAPQGIKFEFLMENKQLWLLYNGSLIIELTSAKIGKIPHQQEITYNGNTISHDRDVIEGIEYLAIFYGTRLEIPSMFAFTRIRGGGVLVLSNNTALYSLSDQLNFKIAEVLDLPRQEGSPYRK